MGKSVKALLRKELIGRLRGLDSLAVVSLTGIDGTDNNRLRSGLRGKGIRLTVVKNSICRQALKQVGLDDVCRLIDGPSALAIGSDNVVTVVRELMEFGRELPTLLVRGALMEGEVFGPERVEELSRYPTRAEALARAAGQVRSPGARLVGAVLGPGAAIAGIVKTVQQRLEEN